MTYNKEEVNQWKEEQILYFQKYITAFKANSKEYNLIKEGIDELQNSIINSFQ